MTDERCLELSESNVYALLGNPRRRLVLRLLGEFSPPLSTTEVARLLAESAESPADRPRRIALSLHHVHLPKLDRAAAVSYDPEERTITHGSNFGTLLGVLEEGPREPSIFDT